MVSLFDQQWKGYLPIARQTLRGRLTLLRGSKYAGRLT